MTAVAAPAEIHDPPGHQRVVFRRSAGDALEVDLYVEPGAFVREHVHPAQVETFEGVSGTLILQVDGLDRSIGPGASIVIPPGTRHGFNGAREAAHLHVTVRPALQLEQYFRSYVGLSRDGRLKVPAKGRPSPLLQLAVVMDRFAPELVAPRIPLPLQRFMWRALAFVARLRGYSSSFPEYGAP
ncbi:MAG TPA: cupin domain-containing protein [Gaiellaceae bacterium]|nr:cupin domain-containing protein [Gaiellaceae bacterium]